MDSDEHSDEILQTLFQLLRKWKKNSFINGAGFVISLTIAMLNASQGARILMSLWIFCTACWGLALRQSFSNLLKVFLPSFPFRSLVVMFNRYNIINKTHKSVIYQVCVYFLVQ